MQSYIELNNLTEVSFIAGNEFTLEFTVYDEDGVAVDISSATVEWNLSNYGQQSNNILNKTGNIISTSVFEVVLESADTIDLYGKYLQQAVITDSTGNVFIPGQGIITILEKIAST